MKKLIEITKNLFKPVDLTKGRPLKVILIFMTPILLSLFFQQIYTISDAAIVGNNLEKELVAGVNQSYSLVFIVIQFAFGCTSGFSAISSQKMGQNDLEGVRKSFAAQLLMSLIISIILTIVAVCCIPFLLNFIGSVEGTKTYTAAKEYIFIIYLGLFTQIFYNLMVSVLRSIGDSLTPLLFLIASTIINICLDILFIVAFKWGVIGAAVATVISQLLAGLASFIYSLYKYPYLRFKLNDFKLNFKFAFAHLKLGLPLALQFSILAIGLIILQKSMNNFGVDAINGYGVAAKYNDFLMTPFSALGTAMLSYMGQNLGAHNTSRIKSGLKDSAIVMLIMYVIFGGLGILTAINGTYTHIFLSSENINDKVKFYASMYIFIDCAFYPILGFLFLYRNILQGLGKSLFPFLAGIGELIGRTLLCEFLPSLINKENPTSDASYIGLCFADTLAWTFAVTLLLIGLYLTFIKGKLLQKLYQENLKAASSN